MYSRAKVLQIARQQLGVAEPRGDDKYIKWYNSTEDTSFATNVAWCFIWVSWVLRAAEIPTSLCPNFASCSAGMKWAKANDVWKNATYVPQPGDLIMWDWKNNNAPDHVGIVTLCDDNYIYSIEGNTSDMVAERKYTRKDPTIFGFITIPYDDAVEQTPAVSSYHTIAEVQEILRKKFNSSIAVDNVWGSQSRAALIKAIQLTANRLNGCSLLIDGIWGPKTQAQWKLVSMGQKNDFVLLCQIALIAKGFRLKADGVFGSKTLQATKEFQKKNFLNDDGIIGQATIAKLVK